MNPSSDNPILAPSSSILLDDFKQRTREQWSANPCGAHVARDLEFGTREYFDAIEDYRYRIDAPWVKEAVGFDRYAGKRLLEIGFGTGTDLLQLARGGARVTGVDLTPRSIEIARRRFEVYGFTGEFLTGDCEDLSFPDASFDVVYSFGVLHHTPDTLRGELLKETPEEIMSRHVEYSETEGRPLVKAFTRAEARQMFREFRRCNIQVNQLTRRELRPIGRLIPEVLFQWLARNFGWNLLITATK